MDSLNRIEMTEINFNITVINVWRKLIENKIVLHIKYNRSCWQVNSAKNGPFGVLYQRLVWQATAGSNTFVLQSCKAVKCSLFLHSAAVWQHTAWAATGSRQSSPDTALRVNSGVHFPVQQTRSKEEEEEEEEGEQTQGGGEDRERRRRRITMHVHACTHPRHWESLETFSTTWLDLKLSSDGKHGVCLCL